MKRLWLGLVLITAASAMLLLSDLSQRRAGGGRIPRVAIFQQVSQGIIDEGVAGMIAALSENGFDDPKTIHLQRFNAEGDIGTANAIARQLTSGEFDLVMTATTTSMQVVANANKAGKVNHVFGLVSDPVGAGVGINKDNLADHPEHLTGIGTMQPVRETFDLARKLYPGLKTVGVVWNPAEANSQANLRLARVVVKDLGIELLEATTENSSGVLEAASSLTSRGAEALWVGGDVAVVVAIDAVVGVAKRARIPVFTSLPGNTEHGAIFDVGANYTEVGRVTGNVAAQVLKGTSPGAIPVRNIVPARLMVNKTALAGLKAPWKIPDDIVAQADSVIDETGTHEKAKASVSSAPHKKWKLQLVELNNVLDVEESESGVFKGLEQQGLVKDRDFEIQIRNAQGDMATLNSLVDAALSQSPDLLLTLSTPTLQAALQRAQGKVPIIFTYVANAIVAGAGTTVTDHRPNVTGVQTQAAVDEIIALVRQLLPRAHRLGTLFVPAEVNMVFSKDEMGKAASKAGMELIATGVATSSEVADAALALVGRDIDVLCQVPGNMTAAAFGGIAQAAARRRIPIFAFQNVQAHEGASVVLGRDYFDAGRDAGIMAARVLRGESPAKIPIETYTKTKLIINPQAARAAGLNIPPAMLSQAELIKP